MTTNEIHFKAVEVLCKPEWQPIFTVGDDGFLQHPLEVRMRTTKQNCFLDILYNGVLQLRFTLKKTNDAKVNILYETNVIYANPWWMLKSFEFALVMSQPNEGSGGLSLTFLDARYEKLLGMEVEPSGLTATPAKQEDTIH